MAQIALFHYQSRESFLHARDPRFKIAALLGMNLLALQTGFVGVAALLGTVLAGFMASGIGPFTAIRQARYLLLLGLFVLVSRMFAGDHNAALPLVGVGYSSAGLDSGLRFFGQFMAIVLAGHLFLTTTPLQSIVGALHWLLSRLPFIPAGRIALMAGLALSFFGVCAEEGAEISAALDVRGLAFRRHPVMFMRLFGIGMLRRVLLRTDAIVAALEARAYDDHRTVPDFRAAAKDWLFLSLIAVLLVLLVATAR